MIESFARLRLGSLQVPKWLAAVLGIAVVLLGLYLVVWIRLSQVDAVIDPGGTTTIASAYRGVPPMANTQRGLASVPRCPLHI